MIRDFDDLRLNMPRQLKFSSFVGAGDYWQLIRVIDAFDARPRRLLGTRSMLRHAEWREAVIRLLLDALYGSLTHAPVVPRPATR